MASRSERLMARLRAYCISNGMDPSSDIDFGRDIIIASDDGGLTFRVERWQVDGIAPPRSLNDLPSASDDDVRTLLRRQRWARVKNDPLFPLVKHLYDQLAMDLSEALV